MDPRTIEEARKRFSNGDLQWALPIVEAIESRERGSSIRWTIDVLRANITTTMMQVGIGVL